MRKNHPSLAVFMQPTHAQNMTIDHPLLHFAIPKIYMLVASKLYKKYYVTL